ncbi:hypothetical protein JOQ06_019431 [Pogonophryne albipinna]|uniref:Uncharacterized protein n=1 Tax=Pogonophryne albipinna TaxID=1090488 RepID=A0AAD6ATG7_9TELE|nr:hypothetical protein JOQ06_019431 [Pogonophryne albipinna]
MARQYSVKGGTVDGPFSTTVPVPKSLICWAPSSVEGISHELENVFIGEDWEQGIQAMDVVDGRRPPSLRITTQQRSSADTRDTDTQAPSSGDWSPSPRPCSSAQAHSPDGSPCSAEERTKTACAVLLSPHVPISQT